MTSSNLTPNDYIIVQRGNTNYRISGDQILNFSREQIGPELDEIRLDLDQEILLREQGDEALRLKYEQLVIRLEDIVTNMLPIHTQDIWKYKIEFAASAQMALQYQTCSGEELGSNPINDLPARCFDVALDTYFTNVTNSVLNKPGSVFFYDYNLLLSGIGAVFVNRYTEFEANAYDWSLRIKVGDYLQISGINPTLDGGIIKDYEKYAIFRVSELLGERVNGGSLTPEQTRLFGFKVEPVVVAEGGFVINQKLQLQFMSSIEDWISDGYVSVEGDTMTGPLDIQLADPDPAPALNTNGRVHAYELHTEHGAAFIEPDTLVVYNETLSILNPDGGVVSLDDGTKGLQVHYSSGARYDTAIVLDDPEQLTHKHYVDEADQELENLIDNLSDRVDGLANVSKTTRHRYEKYESCLGEPLGDWADCVATSGGLTARHFQLKAGGSDTQSWGATNRILVHEAFDPDGGRFDWKAALSLNDVIEVAHNPTDTTPDGTANHYATYAVVAEVDGDPDFVRKIDLNGDGTEYAYEIQVEIMKSKGLPIEGESYVLNYYDRSNGLSLELVTEKFVLKEGDEMTGGLEINFDDDGESYLQCMDGASVKFAVIEGGNLQASGGLVLDYGKSDGDNILQVAGKSSIVFRADEVNLGGSIRILKFGAEEIITIKKLGTHQISVNDNIVTGLAKFRTDSTGDTDAIPRNKLTDLIEVPSPGLNGGVLTTILKRFDAGTGVVTIEGGGARTLSECTDTVLPDNPTQNIAVGEVLAWNGNKWYNKQIGENYGPGKNIFVQSEGECQVGGLWTSGGDNPSFYIRYK